MIDSWKNHQQHHAEDARMSNQCNSIVERSATGSVIFMYPRYTNVCRPEQSKCLTKPVPADNGISVTKASESNAPMNRDYEANQEEQRN